MEEKQYTDRELLEFASYISLEAAAEINKSELPKRIQRKRTKGWKMPENTVSVTRPGKWGNPFKIGMVIRDPQNDDYITTLKTVDDVVLWYKKWLQESGRIENVKELRGKNLACFCPLDQPCHASVLLEIANS